MIQRRQAEIAGAQIATIVVGLYAWQHAGESVARGISRPSEVLDALTSWLGDPVLRDYIWVTLQEAGIGLALAMALAVALASLLAAVRPLADFLAPFIAAVNALPKFALAPLFLLVLGLGQTSKVVFVAVAVFFLPFQSMYLALTTVDMALLAHVRMLGGRARHRLIHVYVPATLRAAIVSLRLTAAFALLAAVLAELVSSQGGVGFQIHTAQVTGRADIVMAGVVIIGLMSFIFDRVLVGVAKCLPGK